MNNVFNKVVDFVKEKPVVSGVIGLCVLVVLVVVVL